MSENKVATMPFSDYEAACNAIRGKTGTSNLIKSGDMAEMIEGIEGGNTEIEDAIISRTISGVYTNNRATIIGNYAFGGCDSLTSANFPVCTSVGAYAFCSCRSLTTVSAPKCTHIGHNAFCSCISFTSANFPVCTSIGAYAFSGCNSLATVSFPVCTSMGSYAFIECRSLTTANFPACIRTGDTAFRGCRSLITVSLPACKTIVRSTFCSCFKLSSLYLTGSSLCTLSEANAFASTPIGGYLASVNYSGAIYVPASLLASYKSAANWAYFSDKFYAFEDGDVDTTIIASAAITFTIDGDSYQAEEGMTWEEWVNTAYNTDNYYVGYEFSNEILSSKAYPVKVNGNYVYADDVIIANGAYEKDKNDGYPV